MSILVNVHEYSPYAVASLVDAAGTFVALVLLVFGFAAIAVTSNRAKASGTVGARVLKWCAIAFTGLIAFFIVATFILIATYS